MIKLGIIGAMTVEVETLKEQMQHMTVTAKAGMDFFEGFLEDLPVTVVVCGIGKVNAALCVQILCDCFHVTHIVNTGVAGSLCAELDIGDLVISRDTMYHDFDCTPLQYPIGQIPDIAVHAFPADDALTAQALKAARQIHPGHVRLGRIASGDQFVSTSEQKTIIHRYFPEAVACDMEGAAIAAAAAVHHVPFAALRTISDSGNEMDYNEFCRIAAEKAAECIARVAEQM